jgi:hypothetical protein
LGEGSSEEDGEEEVIGGYALFDPDDTETFGSAGPIHQQPSPALIRGTKMMGYERNIICDRWTHHLHRLELLAGLGLDMEMKAEDEAEELMQFEDEIESEMKSETRNWE